MSNLRPASLADLPRPADAWALAGFDLTLRHALAPDRHLRARCRCGRHGPIDPAYWVARRWQERSLGDLADQVRCVCGSPYLTLEVAAGPVAPGSRFYVAP